MRICFHWVFPSVTIKPAPELQQWQHVKEAALSTWTLALSSALPAASSREVPASSCTVHGLKAHRSVRLNLHWLLPLLWILLARQRHPLKETPGLSHSHQLGTISSAAKLGGVTQSPSHPQPYNCHCLRCAAVNANDNNNNSGPVQGDNFWWRWW